MWEMKKYTMPIIIEKDSDGYYANAPLYRVVTPKVRNMKRLLPT